MRKWKIWMLERFLPAWAKDSVYRENEAIRDRLAAKEQEIRELNAYIDGMEAALRKLRPVIRTGGAP